MTCGSAARRIEYCVAAALLAAPAMAQETAADGDEPPAMTLSGELRERFETSDNPVFGLAEPAHNDYLLHRVYLAVDMHAGNRLGARIETVSGTATGWDGEPPPTQDDPADVLQAYAETGFEAGGGQLLLRAGRQELKLGSSRLVSLRESPNIRRTFDGARISWSSAGHTRLDAFFVRPVSPESGRFDDRSSAAQDFWGLYVTRAAAGENRLAADFYYLGLDREGAVFSAGRATERRHTIGARLFGELTPLDLNLEGAWQWGAFGDLDIRAWTLSADVGYVVSRWRGSPRFGLKADVISGDRDPADRTLGTFNPLFPRLPYFSEANVATPANLVDVQPNITLTLPRRVAATLSWNGLWKYARQDAFYAPPLAPVRSTAASASNYIGQQLSLLAEWEANPHLNLSATYVYFEPGRFVREAGGQSGNFGAAWAQFTF
ncbi:MAG TPA: alginate export family protein [Steroidobacteraceae bacterium]|jgi:hypothetical protein|nr:alginate export family protein [Steroidobacteraceae bacterium]